MQACNVTVRGGGEGGGDPEQHNEANQQSNCLERSYHSKHCLTAGDVHAQGGHDNLMH